MSNVAQFFDHLIDAFNKGPNSHEFIVSRIGFIGEIRMRTHRVEVATETGTNNPYPLRDLNNLLRQFGVILSRRHVHGTNRFNIYATPINPTFPELELIASPEPISPPTRQQECLACGGTGEMEALWSVIPGPEALPSHECFVCNGDRSVLVCSGCNQQIDPSESCRCFMSAWAVAA